MKANVMAEIANFCLFERRRVVDPATAAAAPDYAAFAVGEWGTNITAKKFEGCYLRWHIPRSP